MSKFTFNYAGRYLHIYPEGNEVHVEHNFVHLKPHNGKTISNINHWDAIINEAVPLYIAHKYTQLEQLLAQAAEDDALWRAE